ncbi:hypothetical protein GA0074692_2951 [Micromonospora pallida]|uniref:Uncharacterized protein n=1 Tax=Micromonospora pallida TaxID=145854 RepID=A0A1C6SM09_9ACTN|nr:hypothetical protein [Micromonospora pallida]SCL30570.1 hypothetical protein GA0074692_2951 [Micromonospora pallida]
MSRTDLVIPSEAVAALRFPPVSLVDGGPAEPMTVRPWRGSLFRRSAPVALPFDPASAPRVRKAQSVQRLEALLLGPLRLVVVAVGTVMLARTWLDQSFSFLPYAAVFAALALQAVSAQLNARVVLPQYPRARKGGALAIRDVPEEVARQWTAMNPAVRSGTDAGGSR